MIHSIMTFMQEMVVLMVVVIVGICILLIMFEVSDYICERIHKYFNPISRHWKESEANRDGFVEPNIK